MIWFENVLTTFSFGLIIFPLISPLKDAPRKGPILKEYLESGQFIARRRMTWSEGFDYCESEQCRLAVLCNLEDAQNLTEAIRKISVPWTDDAAQIDLEFGLGRRYWIGLADTAKEGEFVWQQDGGLLLYHEMWLAGQPDHVMSPQVTKNEHCVVLWNPTYKEGKLHTFNDEPCENMHYPICERKPVDDDAVRSGDLDRDKRNILPFGTDSDEDVDRKKESPSKILLVRGKGRTLWGNRDDSMIK